MSVEVAEALYEAVFAHPGTWTEDEYFSLPEMPTLLDQTCPTDEWEMFPGLNVRLWPGHFRNPDVIVSRGGAMSRYISAADTLLLVEITSPGNFRQDRMVKHGDYAATGVPFYLRVDLEKGHESPEATLFELVDGEYRVAAQSTNGLLRSSVPWPLEADLRALARGQS